MRYQVKRIRGMQAEMAMQAHGLVKIAASSAKDLFDFGVPLVVAPSKVNSFHFFNGWRLAMHLDSQLYMREGWTFESFRSNWNSYNACSELGEAVFFVEKRYVAPRKR